jgi:hypothetical protein
MFKRIACGVVVFSLLMLWPAASAVAEEAEAKLVVLLEELYVFPDKGEEFENLFKEMKEAVSAHGFPYRFDSYKMDDLRYLAIWWIDGTAGIDNLNAAWAALGEKWGEEAAADWTKKFFATMSHWKSSVWVPRPDLSYMPENQADEYKYIAWGILPIKLGHQQEVEEIIKESIEVYAKHQIPYAWTAAQGFVGVENPILGFVEWSASPGSYWTRNDEIHKNEELMKDSGAVWKKMAPHIRGYERETGWYLKDLSYRPKKKAEDTEEE